MVILSCHDVGGETMIFKPFFNRLGGKSRLLKHINPLLPKKIEYYIEPFVGAGWVYFNCNNAEKFIINDFDYEVYQMYSAIKEGNYEELLKYDWKKSEETFYKIKPLFKDKANFIKRDKYEILYFYRYLNYFGVLGDYETFNKTVPKKETPPMERFILCSEKLNINTKIYNVDYKEILIKYNFEESFFYLDPPYLFNLNNDRYKKNDIIIDEFLQNVLNLKGKVLISLSSKSISDEYIYILEKNGFKTIEVSLRYSSDNLQKYKEIKKVNKSHEYLFFKNKEIKKIYPIIKKEGQLTLFN